MIWILGEYCDRIDSVDELLTTFLDNFTDENSQVNPVTFTQTSFFNKFLRVSFRARPGSVTAADGHSEAVPEATGRHPAAGTECSEPGHPGE